LIWKDFVSENLEVGLGSLKAYLVFAQDEAKAWVWSGEPTKLSPVPAVIGGIDKIIYIKELQLTLPMGAVYAGTDVDRR
jgi:hypothetical protein